jgi:hypothetical protein
MTTSLNRTQSRTELLDLSLPMAVLAIFDGRLPHPALSYRCRDPHHIFSTPIEPAGVRITPLWECGIVVTAYRHSPSPGCFIRFSLEHRDRIIVLGSSFQTVAAALLIDLWEDGTSNEALRVVARLFEFRHFDRLVRECQNRSRSETSAERDAWQTQFLKSCENAT